MKLTLKETYEKFEKELNEKFVGKEMSVYDAPTDSTKDLKSHTGIVEGVTLFVHTYDSSAVSQINFTDGNHIYVDESTEIEILEP